VTDADWRVIAAICRRLDGLPLAIELAAARVKLFAPEALLARLDHALPLLAGGSVDLPARQQTLRGAIDWSCTLLEPAQQALFRRLAVFSGGWTVEATEEVARPGLDLGIDVLDGLTELVDHSLVRSVPDGPSGEPRFGMLQLIREFAAERLAETEDAEPVARRHAEWVLDLAESAAPMLEAGSGPAWLDRLGREHDNIRAALRWAIANDEPEIGLRIAASVWRFWQQRGHGREARQWFDRLWPSEPQVAAMDPAVIANAHTAIGGLAYWQNELEESGKHYRAAMEIDRGLGREDRLGNDVYNLGFIEMFTGDLDGARRSFEESADLFRAAGQGARLADTTTVRGALELRADKPAEALPWTLEGRRLNLETGNTTRATDAAMVLSYIHLSLGDLDASEEWLTTAVRETAETGYEARWPLIFDVGMALAVKRGRPFDALRLAAGSARRRLRHGGGAPTFFLEREGILAEARTTAEGLDAAAAEQAWADGDRLGDEELIALIGPQGQERPQS